MVLLECLMVVIMEWLLVVIMGCLVVNLIKKIINDEVSDYLIHNISGDDYHLRLLCNTLINKALKPLCQSIPKERVHCIFLVMEKETPTPLPHSIMERPKNINEKQRKIFTNPS